MLPCTANTRINAVCPWFVLTGMTAKLADVWEQHNLLVNKPAGLAEIIAGVVVERGMNEKAVYVEGDRGWEDIDRCAVMWLGKRQNSEFYRGNEAMEMVRFCGRFENCKRC